MDAGYDDAAAWRYATFSFFSGIILIAILDWLVHRITGWAHNAGGKDAAADGAVPRAVCVAEGCHGGDGAAPAAVVDSTQITLQPPGVQAIEQLHPPPRPDVQGDALDTNVALVGQLREGVEGLTHAAAEGDEEGGAADAKKDETPEEKAERTKLTKMSLLTGLAIAIHNFPEGLATFVATLADASVGISVAIAIALHNIPEGICVAMPVYYATGSRWKGFLWSFLSGVSEPIGALIGYAVLSDGFSDTAFGVIFGMVGGMMVFIALRELLPTAHRYDPEDSVSSFCLVLGMALMAASLLLFAI